MRMSVSSHTVILSTSIMLLFIDLPKASDINIKPGEIKFGFNGVATLGVFISSLLIILGYRLIVDAAKSKVDADSRSNFEFDLKNFRFNLTNATPGIAFAALGCIGLIFSVSKSIG